mmetsp:Transcript_140964/g.351494  ORF Transcript_140964/g.351494 Transcript_140964/m.351494 type:complete len:209 (+) Transcript_140964:786-1412(+)
MPWVFRDNPRQSFAKAVLVPQFVEQVLDVRRDAEGYGPAAGSAWGQLTHLDPVLHERGATTHDLEELPLLAQWPERYVEGAVAGLSVAQPNKRRRLPGTSAEQQLRRVPGNLATASRQGDISNRSSLHVAPLVLLREHSAQKQRNVQLAILEALLPMLWQAETAERSAQRCRRARLDYTRLALVGLGTSSSAAACSATIGPPPPPHLP